MSKGIPDQIESENKQRIAAIWFAMKRKKDSGQKKTHRGEREREKNLTTKHQFILTCKQD